MELMFVTFSAVNTFGSVMSTTFLHPSNILFMNRTLEVSNNSGSLSSSKLLQSENICSISVTLIVLKVSGRSKFVSDWQLLNI